MTKVKKGIVKENLIVDWEIIETTDFLIAQELSKPKEMRSTMWKHVEVATSEDIEKYSTEAQKKEWGRPESSTVVTVKLDDSKMTEILKQVEEVTQMNDLVLSENEELKKQIALLKENKTPVAKQETKTEGK